MLLNRTSHGYLQLILNLHLHANHFFIEHKMLLNFNESKDVNKSMIDGVTSDTDVIKFKRCIQHLKDATQSETFKLLLRKGFSVWCQNDVN